LDDLPPPLPFEAAALPIRMTVILAFA